MFNKASLIALALVLPATASPVAEDVGTRIPFHRRSALTDSEGMFDHAKAARQVIRDHNKHSNNLKNLEANVGRDAFNEGAEIKSPMAYPAVERRQSEPLYDENGDEYWAGYIFVGTPATQKFYIDFDTGSSDLWFPLNKCTQPACNKDKYDPAKSSTSKSVPGTFSIKYGDGSSVSGPIFTDTVQVGGISVKDQAFSGVTTLSPSFGNEKDEGILGLAYPSISNLHRPPFVNNAKAQNVIKQAMFGMKLSKPGAPSELYIGGANTAYYNGDIEYHPVVGDTGYWLIGGGKLTVGSNTVLSDLKTVIDSGTTLVYGPPDAVAKFYGSIPGSTQLGNKKGFYSFPCITAPGNIAFSWGGKQWTISAQNFNIGKVDAAGVRCVGAVVGQDMGLGANTWLVGDSFMKNVYTAFSFEKNAVGFATLK